MILAKIKAVFQRKQRSAIPIITPLEEIVEIMYDKNLNAFSDEVVQVIYSKDKMMRYVVLKNDKDFFTYLLETIYQFSDDEWKYVSSDKSALPAMWEPVRSSGLFTYETDLLKEMQTEPEYKQYF